MRYFLSVANVVCFLSASIAAATATTGSNGAAGGGSVVTSYTNFLNNYKESTGASVAPAIESFLQNDRYVNGGTPGVVDEDRIAHAQISYAIQHSGSTDDSLRQIGLLNEWLDTRGQGSGVRSAKNLVQVISSKLQQVMGIDKTYKSVDALVSLYLNLEPLFRGNPVNIWTIEQFTRFLRIPPIERNEQLTTLADVGSRIAKSKDFTSASLHRFDIHTRAVASIVKNHNLYRIADQIRDAAEHPSNNLDMSKSVNEWVERIQKMQKTM
ncbi:hypothetical protein BDF19DRAFT_454683 [Syncephalis fuscata]|nr:hypothetical protein BDF19DRAFT_454683 [Syncephalis fuscata]